MAYVLHQSNDILVLDALDASARSGIVQRGAHGLRHATKMALVLWRKERVIGHDTIQAHALCVAAANGVGILRGHVALVSAEAGAGPMVWYAGGSAARREHAFVHTRQVSD